MDEHDQFTNLAPPPVQAAIPTLVVAAMAQGEARAALTKLERKWRKISSRVSACHAPPPKSFSAAPIQQAQP